MLDLILGIHLISYHAPAKDYQNNENWGVYAAYNNFTVGAYRNTLRRTSLYAGYNVQLWGPIDITLGGVSGYQKKSETELCGPIGVSDWFVTCQVQHGYSRGAVSLLAAPSVHYGPVRLWFIPSVGRTSSVFHLSLEGTF